MQKLNESEMRIVAALAAMVTTLAEDDGGWMPRSVLYIALGCDINISERAINAAEKVGWVAADSETVRITQQGRAKAAAITAAMGA